MRYHCIVILLCVSTVRPQIKPFYLDNFGLALDAIFGIGIRLQAFLQDDSNENFLVSPISAALITAQLMLGTEGEFREQLVELLALPQPHQYHNQHLVHYNRKEGRNVSYALPYSQLHTQLSHLVKVLQKGNNNGRDFILNEQNALFFNKDTQLNQTFRHLLTIFYDTQQVALDFAQKPLEAQKAINSWISQNTNGLIKSFLSVAPRPTTASIFANAVYFKADWEVPFSDVLNRAGIFTITADRSVPVTFMINSFDEIPYAESEEYRIISLPYKNNHLEMSIMLPRKDSPYKFDIRAFAQTLKAREILETISSAKNHRVVVKIPKMSLSTSFSLLKQLKKYRVYKRNNVSVRASHVLDSLEGQVNLYKNLTIDESKLDDVYLTTATLNGNLRIDDIVQQVIISINEKGTEAAAISASTIDYIGGSKNFLIDRPFIFFIRHKATLATLFWGTVTNPIA